MTSRPMSARAILALAVPALGSLAADPVLSLVDTAFVGQLGAIPLAALGIDTALFAFSFAIFNFLAYATTPMVAQARGRGDIAGSGLIVRRAMALALGLGAISTLALAALAEPLVRLMQAAPEVVDPAVSYLRIRAFAVTALLIITAANGAYRGFKDTRTPLYVTLAVNGLNVVLDWYFIFGLGLGLEGAALATVAAQWIGALVFVWLLRRVGRREQWASDRIRLVDLRPFVSVGGVLVLRTLMLMLSLTVAAAAAARIGTVEVAAHQVVAQLWFLLAMIVDALAIAAQALVAELEGAEDRAGAKSLSDRLLRWGVAAGVVLGVVVAVGGHLLAPLFSPDAVVQDAIRSVLIIAAVMQPLAAWVFVADGIYLARLAIRLLAGSTAVGLGAVLVVLGATLGFGWGLTGVWWAMTAMVVGRFIVLGGAYYRPTLSSS
ncbi:MAG TPA: MATE family efflux transporter [Acidimicrobiia bacterium]|nr:MATE family efflux transporter [Acidimicrobiia bacterium]